MKDSERTSTTSQWCVNCSIGVVYRLRGERGEGGRMLSSSASCRAASFSVEKPVRVENKKLM